MKIVSDTFKTKINEYGRQLDTYITYGINTLGKDNIYSINPNFHTNLMETLMKCVIIKVDRLIPVGTRINVKSGVKIANNEVLDYKDNYEYVDYGYYTIKEYEKDETQENHYTLKCYDDMMATMISYDIKPIFPITVKNLLLEICNRFNFTLNTQTFINDDSVIESDEFKKADFTFRDVLDEIATVTCSTIEIENGIMYVKYPTNSGVTINEDILNDTNVILSKSYGPVNRLILRNTGVDGDTEIQDAGSITTNGLTEVELEDKQLFVNKKTRENMINEMWSFLHGFEYILCDLDTQGLMYIEALDRVNVSIKDNVNNLIIFEDETKIEDGLSEQLYNDEPRFKKNEYSSESQKAKYDAYTAFFRELTVEDESTSAIVYLDRVNQSQPLLVRIQPLKVENTVYNISYLYPRTNLYPNYDLYMSSRTLRFTNTTTGEIFDWELPDNLLYYNDNNYDDLELNFDKQQVIINKKCKWNANGTVGLLANPRTGDNADVYDYPETLKLTDGDYEVELLGYNNAYLYVKLISINQYFSQFLPKTEFNKRAQNFATLDMIAILTERINELEKRVRILEEEN